MFDAFLGDSMIAIRWDRLAALIFALLLDALIVILIVKLL